MAEKSSTKTKHLMNNMCNKSYENKERYPLGNDRNHLDVTVGEIGRIEEALKQEEFRNLLVEYAKEVQDPKAKENYEADIIKLEAERGIKCIFLRPQPGHVVKTRHIDGNRDNLVHKDVSDSSKNGGKVFINICWDPNVAKPESRQAVDGTTGKCGVRWSVPYCQSQPRQETDGKGVLCDVYDVIFHPEAGILANKDPRVKDLLNTTALDAIEKAFGVKLDRKNLKFPKLKYKGRFRPTVIREPFASNSEPSTELQTNDDNVDDTLPGLVQKQSHLSDQVDSVDVKSPEYTLKYKNTHTDLEPATGNILSASDPCRPTELVVEIYLPEMNSAKGVDLDVLERQLTLHSVEPQPYHLELCLPYSVDEEAGTAKFDKSTRMLIVTLPVKPGQPQKPVIRVVSTDSGIGLDLEDRKSVSYANSGTTEDIPDGLDDMLQVGTHETSTDEKLLLPNYTCNIYENLMVLKMDVENVDPESVDKHALIMNEGKERGFSLSFVNIGAGMVPMKYGFKMVFVFDAVDRSTFEEMDTNILEEMEVEVWDNNIIVQMALPKHCKYYRVGNCTGDMKEHPLNHPLTAFKKKLDQFKKNSKSKIENDLESTNQTQQDGKAENCRKYNEDLPINGEKQYNFDLSEEKERHSSGESVDSFLSEPPPPQLDSKNEPQKERSNKNDYDNCIENKDSSAAVSKFVENDSGLVNENNQKASTLQSLAEMQHDIEDCSTNGLPPKVTWQPRGILKRCVRRCFSESHATISQNSIDNLAWSNSIFDAISESPASSASSEDSATTDEGNAHKKSVRFNEVVQRQIFRSTSSIMGQKRRNMKKNEQKLKKRGARGNMKVERRASEGDAASFLDAGFKLSSSFENNITEKYATSGYSSSENGSVSPMKNNAFDKFSSNRQNDAGESKASIVYEDNDSLTDSGVASSYEEQQNNSPLNKNLDKIKEDAPNHDTVVPSNDTSSRSNKKSKKNKKNKLTRGKPQQQGHFIKEINSDLIFDLDF